MTKLLTEEGDSMKANLIPELQDAVDKRERLSKLVIIFSLPKFEMDAIDWAIWVKELRN